jgi:hypothetical protein
VPTSHPTNPPPGLRFFGVDQVYSETGVDLTQLRHNLSQTIEEQWEDARRGAAVFQAFARPRRNTEAAEPRREVGTAMFNPEGIVRQLTAHKVEFVVIGELAMIAHGSAYLTKDFDICYNRSVDNVTALVATFAPLHPYLPGVPAGRPLRFDVATIQADQNFTLITDLGDVDVLGEVSEIGG